MCYCKGGYAAITDANLVLGRILPEFFPNIFGPKGDYALCGCLTSVQGIRRVSLNNYEDCRRGEGLQCGPMLEHTHLHAEDQPLDKKAAEKALAELAEQVNAGQPGQPKKSLDEVLLLLC